MPAFGRPRKRFWEVRTCATGCVWDSLYYNLEQNYKKLFLLENVSAQCCGFQKILKNVKNIKNIIDI
jgi:hypothetical protein